MARAHLRKQVYGLSEPDSADSDICRLTQIRITWHSLATGQSRPGRLKLETPLCETTHHGWRGGAARPAQHRTSDISQKAPRLKLEPQFSIHISYDTPFGINAGGIVVRAALQYAWDSQFESASHACFCKMSHTHIYACIRTCTQIYSVHEHIVLAHMRICPDIQVSSMDTKSCIYIYWFEPSTTLYILSITLHFSHFLFHTKNP